MNVEILSNLIEGEIFGRKDIKINDFSTIEKANVEDITFAFTPRDKEKIRLTKSKVIISQPMFFLNQDKTFIFTKKSFNEVLYILTRYFDENKNIPGKINYFGKNCQIKTKYIGSKNIVVGNNTVIKEGTVLEENVTIGENCIINQNVVIKEGSKIGNNVVIDCGVCLGAESFWGAKIKGENKQVLGLKGVEIGDNVYIGANSTIEKGVLKPTIIEKNSKIGSLVTIAHDTELGENNRIVSLTGIAGCCTIGNDNEFYGQVGIADNIKIGNNVVVYAKSGIREDILDGENISGIPGMKHKDNLKMVIKQRREFYKNEKYSRKKI